MQFSSAGQAAALLQTKPRGLGWGEIRAEAGAAVPGLCQPCADLHVPQAGLSLSAKAARFGSWLELCASHVPGIGCWSKVPFPSRVPLRSKLAVLAVTFQELPGAPPALPGGKCQLAAVLPHAVQRLVPPDCFLQVLICLPYRNQGTCRAELAVLALNPCCCEGVIPQLCDQQHVWEAQLLSLCWSSVILS